MKINEIVQKIKNFNVANGTEDYVLSVFFDEIGSEINELGNLKESEKGQIIKSLFNFQERQSAEMEENWSFIHLIENIEKPSYKNYDRYLTECNRNSATITSILLFNRYINSLNRKECEKKIQILKMISEDEKYSKPIRESALNFYEYHNELKK